jgi:hypothetical protein
MNNLTISSKALAVITLINSTLAKSPTGVSFVHVKNYTNKQNEVSNNLINVGMSYENAKVKDIEFLENLPKDLVFKSPANLIEEARTTLIAAFLAPDKARSEGQIDAYERIINGLKVHKETGILYLYGYRQKKDIIKEGDPKKPVNSAPLTIAKDELRKHLRTGKFTQYALEIGNDIKANGETLEL